MTVSKTLRDSHLSLSDRLSALLSFSFFLLLHHFTLRGLEKEENILEVLEV